MNLRSLRLKMFLLLLFLVIGGWTYKVYHRHNEIRSFFKDQNDLAWASRYLDKKVNFCDAPWQETVTLKNGENEVFISPSGRYEIKPNGKFNEDSYFLVTDNETGRTVKNVTTPFFTDINFKWTEDERFLIFTTSITKDDWISAEIFISDIMTGQTMYFGDSEFYDCELRNW